MAKTNIKRQPVCFNLLDPDQLALLNYALSRPNFSGYIKRLIQRDKEGGYNQLTTQVITEVDSSDEDKELMLSMIQINSEVQRTAYSAKVFKQKMDRYEAYFYGEEWHKENWQPKNNKPVYPRVWVIGEGKYNVKGRPFKLFHTREAKLN